MRVLAIAHLWCAPMPLAMSTIAMSMWVGVLCACGLAIGYVWMFPRVVRALYLAHRYIYTFCILSLTHTHTHPNTHTGVLYQGITTGSLETSQKTNKTPLIKEHAPSVLGSVYVPTAVLLLDQTPHSPHPVHKSRFTQLHTCCVLSCRH